MLSFCQVDKIIYPNKDRRTTSIIIVITNSSKRLCVYDIYCVSSVLLYYAILLRTLCLSFDVPSIQSTRGGGGEENTQIAQKRTNKKKKTKIRVKVQRENSQNRMNSRVSRSPRKNSPRVQNPQVGL